MKSRYKTPEWLKISPRQFEGLVKTMEMLRETEFLPGEPFPYKKTIFGIDADNADQIFQAKNKKYTFGMCHWDSKKTRCGTVRCIGGTAEWLMQDFDLYNFKTKALDRLFFPPMENEKAWNATPTQAANAIEYYLKTGKTKY
jgi:hypothetical protein